MKQWLLIGLLLGASVQAQEVPPTQEAPSQVQIQRARIAAERSKLTAQFDEQEAACYRKFAVNSCLAPLKVKRREAMADLRRQDVILNDAERRRKGAEQLQKAEEKASLENQQKALERRQQIQRDLNARQERRMRKDQERLSMKQGAAEKTTDSVNRMNDAQNKAQERAQKESQAAEKREQYEQKQREVQERRARLERKRLDQQGHEAQPLPLP